MATMNAEQVTVGSAAATGAIFVAPTTATLPTDATTALGADFALLGFTSDAGVQISESGNTQSIYAWEGRTKVYEARTEYTENISFTPIQCNAEVAKLTWGDDMVVVGNDGALTAKHHGKTMERGEQTMDGTQVDGRQLTFSNLADANGVTCYEYTAFN